MDQRTVKIWYDPEGDFLEVTFERAEGHFRATADDRIMEKIDATGRVLGFSVIAVSTMKGRPVEVSLPG